MISLKLVLMIILAVTLTFFVAASHPTGLNQSPIVAQAKSAALYYWFDANTGEYIGRLESTDCDHSNNTPCALGYVIVANPNNPVQPNTPPDVIEYGG